MTLDAEARRLRGRIGAYRLHATHDPRETTAKARATFLASFRAQVEADSPGLPEPEIERRARAALKARMAKLAFEARKRRTA
jgi:hypothetical protein